MILKRINMNSVHKKVFSLLDKSEQKNFKILLLLSLIMALIDVAGIASILPFIGLLSNPSLIETNSSLNYLFQNANNYGISTEQHFFILLGLVVFFLFTFSISIKVLLEYLQLRFVFLCEYSIGTRLLNHYLNQPYIFFLQRNSADLGKNIISEVSLIIHQSLMPIVKLWTYSIVTICIVLLVMVINPIVALSTGAIVSIFYFSIYALNKNWLSKQGKVRTLTNNIRFTSVRESFGTVKEVKINNLESFFLNRFSSAAGPYSKAQTISNTLLQIPRLFLEAFAFGGLILIIITLIYRGIPFNSFLPITVVYILAGYRLMPAIQNIYDGFIQLRYSHSGLDNVYNDWISLPVTNKDNLKLIPIKFENEIELKNIFYNYPLSEKKALKNINLTIPAKTMVGFIGPTGSGKTTIVDLIIGLLEVQEGTLTVDKTEITQDNILQWQKNIGYVPQRSFLVDDTIEANIAFGVEEKDVNQKAILRAAKVANIDTFICNELPKGYQTVVGENGTRLSGGQCQRIGIARALYHNPSILVMDESTSALDSQTETQIMELLKDIKKTITIIFITHRLSALKDCDVIYKISDGKLISKNSSF